MSDYVFDRDDWEMVFEAICFYDMHKEEDSFNDKQDLAWRTLYDECQYQLYGEPDIVFAAALAKRAQSKLKPSQWA
ncbi:hypothetical protein W1080910_056 [Cyanophage S-RIM12 isolate W1_08_0910]|uniref:Uncharacterized protein n=4 Tax=Brizovirus TaxID=2733098 RepID=A0A1D7SZ06_9CAUD|nr:hypothetical protein HOQ64_gp178 [Cyanophage S-RIM12 isolate RW_01_0310]YP_009779250.1 hypothetical protein HOQ65_gp180 [Cyanophage S-RIM12 isolate RW_06_0310]YP_009779465.1 hypothetical protein HOQ66_gp180 [Cyanophage S-RIM12 isolate W1_08_0910]AOO18120.1 hypothetical protein Sn070910_055 [Cyanophage S-RIM12_Sn_07_0910]AOO18333.1 hypothetical protein Sn310910_056 [Cyanophage S-RIM12_Sn_31_0910]AOO18976.1 hypothetical protein W1240910_056 [Cyanophage S-RIM12_W1_24_0910]AOO15756.1 hypotheti